MSVDELPVGLIAFSLSSLALTSLLTRICPSIIYNEIDGKKLGAGFLKKDYLALLNALSKHLSSF
ncbi:hypothetical protein M1O20_05340 [Dehalococcoidia bacterium]|nr:hypothetical protein [Dehalococcoidia bacterium]